MPIPLVDPRGLRFAAAITSLVLAIVLLAGSPTREILLGLQVVVFALGVFGAPSKAPYGLLFQWFVRPRLAAPADLEDSRPPRFAQAVGLFFTTAALVALLSGAVTAGLVLAAVALVAALLNATVGLCLGCELYLILRRATPVKA